MAGCGYIGMEKAFEVVVVKKTRKNHKNMGAVRFDLQGVGILVRKRQVMIGGEKRRKQT